jgi:hypothetical protein
MDYVIPIVMKAQKLRLLPPLTEEVDVYEPMPASGKFSLRLQPQRPGDLCDWIELELVPGAAVRIAAKAGIPVGLWLTIAIEAKRILASYGPAAKRELEARLDEAARVRIDAAVCRAPASALRAYADALRAGSEVGAEDPGGLVVLTPPQAMSTAWEHHARESGMPLGPWLAREAASRLTGRVDWEAAAAERGQSLSEWILRSAGRVPLGTTSLA